MDSAFLLGLGVSIVSGFARWRWPVIPNLIATFGLSIGIGLIIWSQFEATTEALAIPLIGGVALVLAVFDWRLTRLKKNAVVKTSLASTIDQRVTSHGQSGGITAHSVSSPHDQG